MSHQADTFSTSLFYFILPGDGVVVEEGLRSPETQNHDDSGDDDSPSTSSTTRSHQGLLVMTQQHQTSGSHGPLKRKQRRYR